jgi:CRP-like cAMP-binding protein/rhodanese-related sulfurtransferase
MPTTENDNREDLLKSPIFRDMPPEQLDVIARAVENKVVPENGIVFREGDPADSFYIISSGKVRIFVKSDRGFERELSILGPGDSFGEVALLTGESRSANVSALQETRLLVFPKDVFERIMQEHPELPRTFMKEMRGWLLKDQEIIEQDAEAVIEGSRMSWFDFLLIIGLSLLLGLSFNHANPNGIPLFPSLSERNPVPVIGASEAIEEYRQGKALIVDAMPPNFYQKGHIKGAVNMPMSLFDIVYLMNFSEEDKDKPILVYGNTISKPYDIEIAGKLQLRGYTNVKTIEGGLSAWQEKGYPVEGKSK